MREIPVCILYLTRLCPLPLALCISPTEVVFEGGFDQARGVEKNSPSILLYEHPDTVQQ